MKLGELGLSLDSHMTLDLNVLGIPNSMMLAVRVMKGQINGRSIVVTTRAKNVKLARVHSVRGISTDEEASVRLLHLSFRDFILNARKGQVYS